MISNFTSRKDKPSIELIKEQNRQKQIEVISAMLKAITSMCQVQIINYQKGPNLQGGIKEAIQAGGELYFPPRFERRCILRPKADNTFATKEYVNKKLSLFAIQDEILSLRRKEKKLSKEVVKGIDEHIELCKQTADRQAYIALTNALDTIKEFADPSLNPKMHAKYRAIRHALLNIYNPD